MEHPASKSRSRRVFHSLQVVDNSSNLELIISSQSRTDNSATEGQQNSLFRIKRRRDEPMEAIVLESTNAKKASLLSISKSLASLSTQDTADPSLSSASPKPKQHHKMYRRVETISARVAAERGLMAIVESIKRHRDRGSSADERLKVATARKQAASRQGREKVLEGARQLPTQPPQPTPSTKPVPRPAPPSQEEIMMNYMPLVRQFLHTERQKEVSQAARADAEAIDTDLEEYTVEIFAEDSNESEDVGDKLSAVRVRVEPFEFEPVREYASDDEDSDRDSNDSNDPEHPACDYPDEEESDSEKAAAADDDDEVSSDAEDVAWAAAPPKYRAYHSTMGDDDDDDDN